ncbi:transcriptional regulator [Bacillus cereus]|nr:transcriptional regulator [Bacillus cereus]
MTDLVFVNNNNEVVTDSLMVAEVFGKDHAKVIRRIETLEKDIVNRGLAKEGKAIFGLSSYNTGNGRDYKKYVMNKDGFTLLVMGFTGGKALEFQLKYIEEFNRMEQHIKEQREQPKTALDQLQRLLVEGTVELKERVEVIEHKIENKITIDHQQQRIMQNTVEATVRHLWNNGTSHGRFSKKQLFAKAYRRLKDRYGISSYKDVLEKDFEEAVDYMRNWKGE